MRNTCTAFYFRPSTIAKRFIEGRNFFLTRLGMDCPAKFVDTGNVSLRISYYLNCGAIALDLYRARKCINWFISRYFPNVFLREYYERYQ